jgi:hypothetical protein
MALRGVAEDQASAEENRFRVPDFYRKRMGLQVRKESRPAPATVPVSAGEPQAAWMVPIFPGLFMSFGQAKETDRHAHGRPQGA